MNHRTAFKLPFEFDVDRLRKEADSIPEEAYLDVYNPYLDIDTLVGVDLIEATRQEDETAIFAPNQYLEDKPYLKEILNTFKSNKFTYRIQTLLPGGEIRKHRDIGQRFEDGIVRLHIPIQSASGMTTLLNDQVVDMQEGTCWYLDLTFTHQMINNSDQPRVHLLIDCHRNSWWEGIFEEFAPQPNSQFSNQPLTALEAMHRAMKETNHASFEGTLKELSDEIALRKA